MAMPSTAITRLDLSLSYGEFSMRANRKGFVGLRVLPAVGVAQQSGTYAKMTIESLLGPIEDTKRAPKTPYKRDDFEWTTDNFATEDHGVSETLDDRTIAMYADVIKAERIHRDRAINRVLLAFENDVASAVFNATTWASFKTAVGTAWSTAATATPIDDIDAGIESVKSQIAAKPNALILSDFALRKMKRTAEIEDLLKYSGRDDPKNLGILSGLRELLDLEHIIVADGFKNTADKGQTGSFSRLWDTTMAMVAHINDSDDLEDPEPTIGRTIMWNEDNAAIPGADDDGGASLIIEEFREEDRRGSVIRARNDRVIKIQHVEAAHLLTGVTA